MEPNLFKYIWRHSKSEQLVVLAIVLASMPFLFLSLDLPKTIVNKGIQGDGFSGPGSTQTFLKLDLPFSDLLFGRSVNLFPGIQLEQQSFLLALSLLFLALVVVNGLFKLRINTMKGRLGERMLRRLRYELTDRVLRFPLSHLRRMKQAEVATMIKDEVEPLGGFIGDAFITPVNLGGQALTALLFILLQSVWLGAVAVAVVALQAWLIPRLRRRILILGRERQVTARLLAGRIGEIVDGAHEVHANDASNWERADMTARLGRIFHIRFEIYQRKFFVKFLNNFLSQLVPFIYYLAGGLLALSGQIDIGALVAVIVAYKDLPAPIKELIDWDQQRLDVAIKYGQVIEQFQPGEILPPERQAVVVAAVPHLSEGLALTGVALLDPDGGKGLEGIELTVPLGRSLAVVGDSASGKERLLLLLAGLESPTAGVVRLDGQDLTQLPEAVTGRRLGYVGADAYHFPLTVRENLLYGLRHAPLRPSAKTAEGRGRTALEERETRLAGNPVFDPQADWVDREPFGSDSPEAEDAALLAAMRAVEMTEDLYRFGLNAVLDPSADARLAAALVAARGQLAVRLAAEGFEDLVVPFDPDRYNKEATVADNVLFAAAVDPAFRAEALPTNAIFLDCLSADDLRSDLTAMGLAIARTMIELFADLPPGHPFFEQFSFIEAEDLPLFKQTIQRADKRGLQRLTAEERNRLLALTFGYSEARHRLGLIDEGLEAKFLAARRRLRERIDRGEVAGLSPYDPERFLPSTSVLENVLFGRLAYGRAHAEEIVLQAVGELLDDLGLKTAVVGHGLDFNVGVAGKRLSSAQRQKLGLARALVKRPDILLVNDALAVLDGASQNRIVERVLQSCEGRAVVWALTRATVARKFDRVAVMAHGRVVAEGSFAELNRPNAPLAQLLAGE